MPNIKFNIKDCSDIIEKKLQSQEFRIVDFEVTTLKEKRGYFGEHYQVKIEVEYRKGVQEFYFFAKCIAGPSSGVSMKYTMDQFDMEIFIYDELFEKILNADIFCFKTAVPECFLTKSKYMLIFEDLTKIGFEPLPRYECLDYNHVIQVIKALAKIHASCLIYEEKELARIGKFFANYHETFYSLDETHEGHRSLFAALNGLYTEIDLFDLNFRLSKQEFKDRAKKACTKMFDLIKPSQLYRNVISHGDLWQTNFMMKYDKYHPIQCKIIDFQTARYVPPAQDLMAFLYLTTTREFKKLHLKDISDVYYGELQKHFAVYSCDLKKVISYTEFLQSCEHEKLFGAMQAATYFQLTAAKSEMIEELVKDKVKWEEALYEDHSIIILKNLKDEEYRSRLEDSLLDLHDVLESAEF